MPYKDLIKDKEARRKYYLKHRERINETGRKYRLAHQERGKELDREYYLKHRARINESNKAYKKLHPERDRERGRKYRAKYPWKQREIDLMRKYGLTPLAYQLLSDGQGGKCAICGEQPKVLMVDHDHNTKVIRGLLCGKCNKALGLFKDNGMFLSNATRYLRGEGI